MKRPLDPVTSTTASEGLKGTKLLHAKVSKAIASKDSASIELAEVKAVLRLANQAIATLRRELALERARARAERDALKAEVGNETIDQAAHVARVAERHRVLFEKATALAGQEAAHERASQAAQAVEAALATICPSSVLKSRGISNVFKASSG